MPSREHGDLRGAERAETILLFPEVEPCPSPIQVVCHMHIEALSQRRFHRAEIKLETQKMSSFLYVHYHILSFCTSAFWTFFLTPFPLC